MVVHQKEGLNMKLVSLLRVSNTSLNKLLQNCEALTVLDALYKLAVPVATICQWMSNMKIIQSRLKAEYFGKLAELSKKQAMALMNALPRWEVHCKAEQFNIDMAFENILDHPDRSQINTLHQSLTSLLDGSDIAAMALAECQFHELTSVSADVKFALGVVDDAEQALLVIGALTGPWPEIDKGSYSSV